MSKRERIEDLGRIYQIVKDILVNGNSYNLHCRPFEETETKHSYETFIEKYQKSENLEDLFDWIRGLNWILEEVQSIARGDDSQDE
jgi:uncharacterized protein YfkK (UPF0435 family)